MVDMPEAVENVSSWDENRLISGLMIQWVFGKTYYQMPDVLDYQT